MNNWNGLVVLITGAGSGIGRGFAQELVRRGAGVVVAADRDGSAVEQLARETEGIVPATLDVRDAAAFRDVVRDAEARFGRVDVLVNNAGLGVAGEMHELRLEHWQRVLEVNLYGVLHGIQAVYPQMVARRSGRIVNVASLAGFGPVPFVVPYGTSKAAVVGLSRGLRLEAAMHGVKVNVVCPSAIETPLLDRGPAPDLPPLPWRPLTRRYLTALAGPPVPLERFVRDALDAVERDVPVIVLPARAKLIWRLGRFLPALSEKIVAAKARAERAQT
jgi:NAD(P)-dependent dehydrogenase (short-subunit alcohol dehydrogenase family)